MTLAGAACDFVRPTHFSAFKCGLMQWTTEKYIDPETLPLRASKLLWGSVDSRPSIKLKRTKYSSGCMDGASTLEISTPQAR